MNKFLIKLLLFSFPFLLLLYPLDIFISNNLKQSDAFYGEYEVWNDIYNGKINANLVVYGSSIAWVNISPKILEDSLKLNVYNLGLDGHNFWLQYLRHKEFIKYNISPKHILLTVDFNTLQKRKNLYLSEQFLPYMLWNRNIRKYTQSYKGFNKLEYYVPLIRYLGKSSVLEEAIKISYNKNNQQPYRIQGYKGVKKNWTNNLEKAKAKMTNYKIKIDTQTVDLFETFLKECNNNSIKITLVYPPEYIEGQKFIKNHQVIIDNYSNYAKKYNIHFLNYSKDTICFNKRYFYNTLHLNKIGSELFSKTLAKDLKKLK